MPLSLNLIYLKLIMAVMIACLACIAALLARSIRHLPSKMTFAEAFSRGLLLGIALFHMLPEANQAFYELSQTSVPFLGLYWLCAFGFLIPLSINKGLRRLQENTRDPQTLTLYLTTLLLCIHAISAGAVLGVTDKMTDVLTLFFGIIAHKGFVSFALAVLLLKNLKSSTYCYLFIVLFSLMTPLGILLGLILSKNLGTNISYYTVYTLLVASLNALTAGSFLYLGVMSSNWKHLYAGLLGLVMMGLLQAF